MAKSISTRVRQRRDALRQAGLRPVQIWVRDTKAPGFAEECQRQSRLLREAEEGDPDLRGFMDGALADLAASREWQ